MEFTMLSRKRPLFDGDEKEPPPYSKKCLATQLDTYQNNRSNKATQYARLKSNHSPLCTQNGGIERLSDAKSFFEQISSWADTQNSGKRVLEHLKSEQAISDIFLNESVNKKFLEFHRNISEECSAEDKQHSWAVIEKREEIIMYGPYYPNYNNRKHSEDTIIKQTQELLDSEAVLEDWKVYIFTVNSPCLARNTEPCMLNLVQKAQEWWSVYGVKTHIGYVRCWGFKGTKETLFRDVTYRQVDCIDQTEDHESYVQAAEKSSDLNALYENLYSAVKHLLRSGNLSFPLITSVQEQDWKSYFKSMNGIYECKPEDEKKVLIQEGNTMIEAVQVLLSKKSGSFRDYLEKGQAFALHYTIGSQVSDTIRDQMRLTFQQCWREMVQDKYAEFIKEKLTEQFNQCTVQLFIKDIKFTKEFLQIGRIQFSEEDSKAQQIFQ